MNKRRIFTSDEVLNAPGTYYNPVTEVVVTVDDTNYVDISEVNLNELSGSDWVQIDDKPQNDSSSIQELLQQIIELEGSFQSIKDISDTSEELGS